MKSTVNGIITLIVFMMLVLAMCGEYEDTTTTVEEYAKWMFIPWLVQVIVSNWKSLKEAILDVAYGINRKK